MISNIPLTLGLGKYLTTITNFVNELRTDLNIKVDETIYDLVDSFNYGQVTTGEGIVEAFVTKLLDVQDKTYASTLLADDGKPSMAEEVIKIDKYKRIPLQWETQDINLSITRGTTANDFLSLVMSTLESTKSFFLYDECINEMKTWYNSKGSALRPSQTLQIERAKASASANQVELNAVAAENSTKVAKAVRKLINNFSYKSTDYNEYDKAGKGCVNAGARDLVFYVSDTYWTNFLADSMASLFHAEKVGDMLATGKIVLLPENVVKMIKPTKTEDFIGILVERNKFAKADFYNLSFEFLDGSNMVEHFWLHFAYGLGTFKHKNGVILEYKDAV